MFDEGVAFGFDEPDCGLSCTEESRTLVLVFVFRQQKKRGGLTDTLYGVSCQSTAVGGDFVSHYPRSLEVKQVSQATWSGTYRRPL